MNCPECKARMKRKREAMEFEVNPKVIVGNVGVSECCNCGFSSVSETEYERVRKQLKGVKAPHGATVIM